VFSFVKDVRVGKMGGIQMLGVVGRFSINGDTTEREPVRELTWQLSKWRRYGFGGPEI
jgi:hypothetical protein